MSRSAPDQGRPQNPAKTFFRFSGDSGKFNYYDKEKKEQIEVPLPFHFLVLDYKLHTIGGYSDDLKSGFWSNEVRNLKEDPFVVFSSKGEEVRGIYSEIKGKLTGMEYTNSVYIAFLSPEKTWEIGNIKFRGSSLTEWIDFLKALRKEGKEKEVTEQGIAVKTVKELKKGKTAYKAPIFELVPIKKQEILDRAAVLDQQLQVYLAEYFKSAPKEEAPAIPEEKAKAAIQPNTEFSKGAADAFAVPEDDLPF